MSMLSDEYDKKSGRPRDKSYLECGLPGFLQESLEQMKAVWAKRDAGDSPSDF